MGNARRGVKAGRVVGGTTLEYPFNNRSVFAKKEPAHKIRTT